MCRYENREKASFCEACGNPVRRLDEIPPEWVESFKRSNPGGYVVAQMMDAYREGDQE